MSCLTIIQNACDMLSLTRPSMAASSTDLLVRQLFGLLKKSGEELSKYGGQDGGTGWEALIREESFLTVAQAEQTNATIPDDFRRFIPDTIFNRTSGYKLGGPLTPRQWQQYQARPFGSAFWLAMRQREDTFLIYPSPAAGETIAYEYVSSFWAKSDAGVAKATFTADEDETYLDEGLLELDLIWRFKHAKGLDYGEDMASFERAKLAAYGADGGAGALNIGGPARLPYGEPAIQLSVETDDFAATNFVAVYEAAM